MVKLDEHPTVKHFYENQLNDNLIEDYLNRFGKIDSSWLIDLCKESGADDVGFVEVGCSDLAKDREDILKYIPHSKTLISFVCRMNRSPVRSPARSVANLEFHHTGETVNKVASAIVSKLEKMGVRAVNPSMGFPMEMDKFPGKIWLISHKTVAVAAGLGQMGIHRNVIHPKYGNFILLGTILIDFEVDIYAAPIDYNPCLECKLCVAACPVGAISSDGHFNFSSCYTHNYREFMGGFTDWVEGVTDCDSAKDYSRKFSDSESASMWQSLSFGANYKAAYCMAVCPAGEDVIRPFLENRKTYLDDVVRPLQEKEETLYVVPGSDAEEYSSKRFRNKNVKRVSNGLHPKSARGFMQGLGITFQREQSKGLDATYHFTFTGEEYYEGTVVIQDRSIQSSEGHNGEPDLHISADIGVWLGFLRKERSLIWSILTRKIRLSGSIMLLKKFGKCFAS